jgi:hypothetical protein
VVNICQRLINPSTPEVPYPDRRKRTVEVANGPPPQKPHLARHAKIRPTNTVPPPYTHLCFQNTAQTYTRHLLFPNRASVISPPESFDNTVAPAFSALFLPSCYSIYIPHPTPCSCTQTEPTFQQQTTQQNPSICDSNCKRQAHWAYKE